MDGSQITEQTLREAATAPGQIADGVPGVARDAPVIHPATRAEPEEPAQRRALPDDAYSACRRGPTLPRSVLIRGDSG